MTAIRRDLLRRHPHGMAQLEILEATLGAIDPAVRVTQSLLLQDDTLHVGEARFPIAQRPIWILSIGKASVPMARAAERLIGLSRMAGGVAITRRGYGGPTQRVQVIEADHPVPRGTEGAQAVIDIAARVEPDDLVICLLSGGGSALLASPPEHVSLADIARTTELMLRSGMTIDDMNIVRRHISRLQGGQLAARLYPATVITLILSDVLGDRLESIASGPTVPDPTTFADAYRVLDKVSLLERLPQGILAHLQSGLAGAVRETRKPGDVIFQSAHTQVIGNNETAVDALSCAAKTAGYAVHRCEFALVGEARDIGAQLADRATALARRSPKKWALIGGGETTVSVVGHGQGGRNQEMALAAALRLDGVDGVSIACLATDGTDGITDAAGALVDGQTAALARQHGVDPDEALSQNDSYSILTATRDLLWTGPTQTNVADLVLILGRPTA